MLLKICLYKVEGDIYPRGPMYTVLKSIYVLFHAYTGMCIYKGAPARKFCLYIN